MALEYEGMKGSGGGEVTPGAEGAVAERISTVSTGKQNPSPKRRLSLNKAFQTSEAVQHQITLDGFYGFTAVRGTILITSCVFQI